VGHRFGVLHQCVEQALRAFVAARQGRDRAKKRQPLRLALRTPQLTDSTKLSQRCGGAGRWNASLR
jgi:hypothetical protein